MEEKALDKLELVLNDDGFIESFSRYGSISGSVTWTGTLPEDFEGKFKPSFYLLKNGEIIENPDYVEPIPAKSEPSEQDKINAQLMLNQAQQKKQQDGFNSQILLQVAKLGGDK
ncbi:DUF2977 domain-containing protein [Pediococcus acidilactici]|uniref:DUF2977 domain-containing protein n=1 Tax=Pediococcus acidilactici TaxID=1254 RepID=UPI00132BD4E1|nr:DUF2977 domain-containing protein [Pediococcus acidilactici]KAF0372751.1 DUF2977 domain-containing protein [Pediococcus acidilactici]KAF0383378.1 DUF2977 domain-containing protein [Pediococcus acidilactici]KAF0457424.1 DUF2977 domain-containing protein [Pediococcus acidilactici]KAF0476442.1 DUF2977 domain-containing protein [Pediococcus acidilactici]KAF0536963.1 DUF2977 domain-containing protein [Pediococcus acidilactici]